MNIELNLNDTEKELLKNNQWPIKLYGVLEAVDTGDPGDSGYYAWVAGALHLKESEDGLGVMLDETVFKESGLFLDDIEDKEAIFWLWKPDTSNYILTLDVQKVELVDKA